MSFVYFLVYLLLLPVSSEPVVVITDCALVVGVWMLGRNLRLRRAYFAELEDRAARLERARGRTRGRRGSRSGRGSRGSCTMWWRTM